MIERELRGRRDDGVASSSLGLENVREKELWNVEGESVLELGAGAALPSMIALLAGAKNVTITDHPSAKGIYGSIPQTLSASVPTTLHNRITIHPHTWGVLPGAEQGNTTVDAATKRELEFAESGRSTFSRIICADCLWMPEQHDNLARSIAWFLAPPAMPMSKARAAEAREGNEGSGGAAYVVAGFHTGREVVASFFENAVPGAGLKIERIYERDLNARPEDGRDGMVTRGWEPRRPGETDRSRWCVVAFLRRRF
ncbi:hypothetical protein KEM55_009006 [Ascosphaera atra]|nr:hypothetical protein KEM55_009006 [Ascosphaera atra]